MTRILVLGGTTEAMKLAATLSDWGVDAVFSYAGRTNNPTMPALPVRMGGFGGVPGLVQYLRDEGITHVVDATHPFAAQMSNNAVVACEEAGVELCALERGPWRNKPGDSWSHVEDMAGAVAALPESPRRIFLAIGRQYLSDFAGKPQHFYLLRLVDAPEDDLPLPNAVAVQARGPFTVAGDKALLEEHKIDLIVAKNSGGVGARAKLDAARELGIPVILIDRPHIPTRPIMRTVTDVMDWLDHALTDEVGA
jgi:precorrin-6A/cobalt-precorrin-6A reductase